MATLILYPAVGETVLDEDGNVIPAQGITAEVTAYYQAKLLQGLLLSADPLASGDPPALPPGVRNGWFVSSSASTTPQTAESGGMLLFNLSALGADAIVNVPISTAAGDYFGVSLVGQALGHKLEVKTGSTVLCTLDVDDESAWLVYTGSAWRVFSRYAPAPIFESRFSPLGCWLSDGTDVDLVDTSGNGRNIAKSVTIVKGVGYAGRFGSASPTSRYLRASDATFQLLGAMSYEFVANNWVNAVSSGYAFMCGTSAGSSATNILWGLRIEAASGVPRLVHRQQNGTNLNADLTGPALPFGQFHCLVARGADAAGVTPLDMYVNGALAISGSATTPTGGGSSQLGWGGTSGAQAPLIGQWGSVYGSKLTAAQAAYLARLRMGKLRQFG